MLRVAALTGGRFDPSARFRVRQLIPALHHLGIQVREFVPPVSKYPPTEKWWRPIWGGAALAARILPVLATHGYDAVLLQRELISTFLTLEPLTKRPRVLDVDDAIFLRRGGRFAKRLAGLCDSVICGNAYLADRFSKWNSHISVIPTGVDVNRFRPPAHPSECSNRVIGWIGTSVNFRYLYQVESALSRVLEARPDAVVRIVSDRKPKFSCIRDDKVDYVPWSPDVEVKAIQGMTVGIMPLADSDWARGKCSYKMLQYMACGVPVVVSPVGMNVEVLSLSGVGSGARTQNEWVEALADLLSGGEKSREIGRMGRRVVEKHFSLSVISSLVADQFAGVMR